jgi:hypothetical protein
MHDRSEHYPGHEKAGPTTIQAKAKTKSGLERLEMADDIAVPWAAVGDRLPGPGRMPKRKRW